MAEMSDGWNNIDVIPGAKVARRAVEITKSALRFLPVEGYFSDYPKHPERRGAAAMLDLAMDEEPPVDVVPEQPLPGRIGGVACRPTFGRPINEEADRIIRGEANRVIN